jgi:hypothetical protein
LFTKINKSSINFSFILFYYFTIIQVLTQKITTKKKIYSQIIQSLLKILDYLRVYFLFCCNFLGEDLNYCEIIKKNEWKINRRLIYFSEQFDLWSFASILELLLYFIINVFLGKMFFVVKIFERNKRFVFIWMNPSCIVLKTLLLNFFL